MRGVDTLPAVSSVLSHLFRLLIARVGLPLVSGDKRAAEILGISRDTLYKKMKLYGI